MYRIHTGRSFVVLGIRSLVFRANRSFFCERKSERATERKATGAIHSFGIKRGENCPKHTKNWMHMKNICSFSECDLLKSRVNHWRGSFLKKLWAIRSRTLFCKERWERKNEEQKIDRGNSQPWQIVKGEGYRRCPTIYTLVLILYYSKREISLLLTRCEIIKNQSKKVFNTLAVQICETKRNFSGIFALKRKFRLEPLA